ncbi:MAG TPA: DUF4112 domain-containing protein [Novosphingobium sp.]|nr:DUF4112 domain-containing protein [Novosphingobium sp.]HMP57414.1 DUF4112 domain-containing protein [Novosphingobium sp.]
MTVDLPLGTDPQAVRRRVEALEALLERSVRLPVIGPVGLDALLGLLPVGGDVIAGALGLYLVWEARNLGLSKWQQARMIAHVGFDTLVGSVPVAGDLFDFLYRSNSRNLKIIRRHLDRHHPATRVIEG